MTNSKEALAYIDNERKKLTKAKREIAVLAFDHLLKKARENYCIDNHWKGIQCSQCTFSIAPDSADYNEDPSSHHCYARLFHETMIIDLTKKEKI